MLRGSKSYKVLIVEDKFDQALVLVTLPLVFNEEKEKSLV